MSSTESKPGHRKIVEFIPYKTMAMDLESILASLARIYVSRNDAEMVELISLAQPELFPVGSFDAEALTNRGWRHAPRGSPRTLCAGRAAPGCAPSCVRRGPGSAARSSRSSFR